MTQIRSQGGRRPPSRTASSLSQVGQQSSSCITSFLVVAFLSSRPAGCFNVAVWAQLDHRASWRLNASPRRACHRSGVFFCQRRVERGWTLSGCATLEKRSGPCRFRSPQKWSLSRERDQPQTCGESLPNQGAENPRGRLIDYATRGTLGGAARNFKYSRRRTPIATEPRDRK